MEIKTSTVAFTVYRTVFRFEPPATEDEQEQYMLAADIHFGNYGVRLRGHWGYDAEGDKECQLVFLDEEDYEVFVRPGDYIVINDWRKASLVKAADYEAAVKGSPKQAL